MARKTLDGSLTSTVNRQPWQCRCPADHGIKSTNVANARALDKVSMALGYACGSQNLSDSGMQRP